MELPILTYHSLNISGNDYCNNDHIAFEHDIELIHKEGFTIIPLLEVVRAFSEGTLADLKNCIALTFDDGSHLDYHDVEHPAYGVQKSFFNIMMAFEKKHTHRKPSSIHSSSFVIASPEAREELDLKCLNGSRWWTDDWWHKAADSGLLSIENHSWDHNHPVLDVVAQQNQIKGIFTAIDNYHDAHRQIKWASTYINTRLKNHSVQLFAYPYGESNEYLTDDYFPGHRHEHQTLAAFVTGDNFLTANSNQWAIPRFVCGSGWNSPEELLYILNSART